MSERLRTGDLEISQDIRFQRREWQVQRVGWAIMAVLLVAACAGLFGPGLFSKTTAASEAGLLHAEYHRFWRMQSRMPLRVHFTPVRRNQNEVEVSISRAYLESMRVETVVPEPERVEVGTDHFVYVFRVTEAAEAVTVIFTLEPDDAGTVSGEIRVDGGAAIRVRHFIYP